MFAENDLHHWPEDGYKFKVVICTSESSSVNFGKKTGFMKRITDERTWLKKIHPLCRISY